MKNLPHTPQFFLGHFVGKEGLSAPFLRSFSAFSALLERRKGAEYSEQIRSKLPVTSAPHAPYIIFFSSKKRLPHTLKNGFFRY